MKIFYSLAFIAAMFLLACSADGLLTDYNDPGPPVIDWSKDMKPSGKQNDGF